MSEKLKRFSAVAIAAIAFGPFSAFSAVPAFPADANQLEAEMSAGPDAGEPASVGLDIQYTPIRYQNYTWVDDVKNDQTGNGLHVAMEWLPFPDRYGKFGVGFGFGLYRIKDVPLGQDRVATLYAYPLEGFLSYRFDYFRDQILVPYGKFGSSLTLVNQSSTTGGGRVGTQVYPNLDYAAGLEICLDPLDSEAAYNLHRGVGIKTTYLLVEYLKSSAIDKSRIPSLAHEEFRLGLRFEM